MLTPEQKIKREIILWESASEAFDHLTTGDEVDAAYEELVERDGHWDGRYELRSGDVETNLPCESSRHYESKAVAKKCCDGSWIGWTYWYGGGKHGEPEATDWMNEAYELTVTEEQRMVTVRTFMKS